MACAQVMNDNDLARFRTKLCQRYLTGVCEFDGRCQYSHKQDQHQRRCPFLLLNKEPLTVLRYIPVLCEHSESECYRGMGCPFAHSEEEIFFHPLIYKQKLCSKYHQHLHKQCSSATASFLLDSQDINCKSYYCPFVHDLKEKRTISNFSYFLAPSFSNKLSASIPRPLTCIPVSKINTSRLSDVNLKETPWLRRLIVLNSSSETPANKSTSLSPLNNSFESFRLTTPSEFFNQQSSLSKSNLLEIPVESVKLGCLYLAAGSFTEKDIIFLEDSESPRLNEGENSVMWSDSSSFKNSDSIECPTLLNKVFVNNFCFSKKKKNNQVQILWLSPGNVIQILFVKKITQNFNEFGTDQLSPAGLDSRFKVTNLNFLNKGNSNEARDWAYGRCVSGNNKGCKGWFPLSLCFGFHQDDVWSSIEVPKALLNETFGDREISNQSDLIGFPDFREEMLYEKYADTATGICQDKQEVTAGSNWLDPEKTQSNAFNSLLTSSIPEDVLWLKDVIRLISSNEENQKQKSSLNLEKTLELQPEQLFALDSIKSRFAELHQEVQSIFKDTLSPNVYDTDALDEKRSTHNSEYEPNWKVAMRYLCFCEFVKPVVTSVLTLLDRIELSLGLQRFGKYKGKHLVNIAKRFAMDNPNAHVNINNLDLEELVTNNITETSGNQNFVTMGSEWFSLPTASEQDHDSRQDISLENKTDSEANLNTFCIDEKEKYLPQLRDFSSKCSSNQSLSTIEAFNNNIDRIRSLNPYIQGESTRHDGSERRQSTLLHNEGCLFDSYNPTVTPSHKAMLPCETNAFLGFLEKSRIASLPNSAESSSTADCTEYADKKLFRYSTEAQLPSEMDFTDDTPFPTRFTKDFFFDSFV